jgi:hypothetical protein
MLVTEQVSAPIPEPDSRKKGTFGYEPEFRTKQCEYSR